jgi:hypothetical protein
MDQKIKKLWVKALQSGEFKQGRGHLEKDGCYCALGVLSVLALLEGICTYEEVRGVGTFDKREFKLSYNVMKWANIAQDNERYLIPAEHGVIVSIKGEETTIMELNDKGLSFKKLASIIERHL